MQQNYNNTTSIVFLITTEIIEKGDIELQEISKQSAMTQSAIWKKLQQLVDQEILEKEKSPRNPRRNIYKLTEKYENKIM